MQNGNVRFPQDENFISLAGMTALGHEERFPRPRPSDRCRFEEETFAGASANGRDAP